MGYDYSFVDWVGLHNYLGDVPWEDIFKLSASAAGSEFCERVQVGIDEASLIISIRSNLTCLHGFQQLLLLPEFIEIIFIVCTNRINLLNLK